MYIVILGFNCCCCCCFFLYPFKAPGLRLPPQVWLAFCMASISIYCHNNKSSEKQIHDIGPVACRETLLGRLEDVANGLFSFSAYDHLVCIVKRKHFCEGLSAETKHHFGARRTRRHSPIPLVNISGVCFSNDETFTIIH